MLNVTFGVDCGTNSSPADPSGDCAFPATNLIANRGIYDGTLTQCGGCATDRNREKKITFFMSLVPQHLLSQRLSFDNHNLYLSEAGHV